MFQFRQQLLDNHSCRKYMRQFRDRQKQAILTLPFISSDKIYLMERTLKLLFFDSEQMIRDFH
jgi:hypothetical protein